MPKVSRCSINSDARELIYLYKSGPDLTVSNRSLRTPLS
jgi:hypothetical protein